MSKREIPVISIDSLPAIHRTNRVLQFGVYLSNVEDDKGVHATISEEISFAKCMEQVCTKLEMPHPPDYYCLQNRDYTTTYTDQNKEEIAKIPGKGVLLVMRPERMHTELVNELLEETSECKNLKELFNVFKEDSLPGYVKYFYENKGPDHLVKSQLLLSNVERSKLTTSIMMCYLERDFNNNFVQAISEANMYFVSLTRIDYFLKVSESSVAVCIQLLKLIQTILSINARAIARNVWINRASIIENIGKLLVRASNDPHLQGVAIPAIGILNNMVIYALEHTRLDIATSIYKESSNYMASLKPLVFSSRQSTTLELDRALNFHTRCLLVAEDKSYSEQYRDDKVKSLLNDLLQFMELSGNPEEHQNQCLGLESGERLHDVLEKVGIYPLKLIDEFAKKYPFDFQSLCKRALDTNISNSNKMPLVKSATRLWQFLRKELQTSILPHDEEEPNEFLKILYFEENPLLQMFEILFQRFATNYRYRLYTDYNFEEALVLLQDQFQVTKTRLRSYDFIEFSNSLMDTQLLDMVELKKIRSEQVRQEFEKNQDIIELKRTIMKEAEELIASQRFNVLSRGGTFKKVSQEKKIKRLDSNKFFIKLQNRGRELILNEIHVSKKPNKRASSYDDQSDRTLSRFNILEITSNLLSKKLDGRKHSISIKYSDNEEGCCEFIAHDDVSHDEWMDGLTTWAELRVAKSTLYKKQLQELTHLLMKIQLIEIDISRLPSKTYVPPISQAIVNALK